MIIKKICYKYFFFLAMTICHLLGYIIGPLDWFTVLKRNIIAHWGHVYYGHQ